MADFFLWYAILWLIGIAGLPLSFTFFSRLPDRGYSFTRPLSLLLVTLVAWWLGNLKLLPFDGLAGWLAIGLVGLGAWLLLLNRKVCRELFAWFSQRQNLKYVLAGELVFLASYSFIVNARSFMVDQHPVTEKFFNLGFINAIATSTTLPPPDPWFGGQPINYYYGGHLIIAELCKLSGVGANIGYNLGIGLIFALTALACYGLVANLVGLAKSKPPAYNESALSEEPSPLLRPTLTKNSELETRNSSIWAGVLGAALVMFFGNLGVVRQWWIHGFQLLPFGNPDFPFKLDWYNTSRLIFDVMPRNGVETILTEYPISSALKGDLHAFDMSGPYIALVLGLVLHLLVEPARFALVRSRRSALPNLLMAGLLVGALSFINGVDFPNFLLLLILGLGLAELRAGGRWWFAAGRCLLQLVGLGIALKLVYFFYNPNFAGMVQVEKEDPLANTPVIGFLSKFLGFVNWPRTNLSEYLLMYGLFLLPILAFYSLRLRQLWQEEKDVNLPLLPGRALLGIRVYGVAFVALGGLGLINFITDLNRQKITLESWLLTLLAGVAAFWTLWPGAWEALRRRPRLALEGMAVLLLFALVVLLRIELLGPVAILFYLSFRFIRQDWKRPGLASSDIFVMLLVTVGSALVLFGELIYVRDIFNNRYNTVFKFWYQVWTLYGIAAAYATWRVLSWQPVPAKSSARRENFSPLAARPPLLSRLFSSETNLFAGVLPLVRLPRPNEGPELGQSVRYSLAPRKTFLTTPLEAARPRSRSAVASRVVARWRWLFSGLLEVLLLLASLVPILGYWQETGHYANRVGLEGEVWYARQFPAEYPAMRWFRDYLRADPSRYGKVLEANGMNYSWGDRISVYTGLPTLVGWPFHELSWRGGYLDEMAIWQPWLDMDRIYETTDSQQALALLKQYKVRYVFVGQIENGSRDGGQNSKLKHFSPAALAKFGSFMKTIYADPINNIYIYAFY